MLNKSFFQQLKKKHDSYSQLRSKLIGVSNNALRNAKRAIFSLQRDEVKEAEKLIKEVEASLGQVEKSFTKEPKLAYEGAYLAALEEYVEARLFSHYLKKKEVEMIKDKNIGLNTYLAGLSDFTGELARKAVLLATKGKNKEVQEIKKVVERMTQDMWAHKEGAEEFLKTYKTEIENYNITCSTFVPYADRASTR